MSKPTLRIAHSPTESRRQRELDRITGTAEPKTVAIPLGKIVPLLIDAVESDRAWLNDFSEDLVKIDSDLYDVLLAYGDLTKRAAA
jgi:hypothetical protein